MDQQRKKQLQEQYKNRHPDMGIVCWKCGDRMWIAKSRDARADYNTSLFQLQLGSWPNRELQKAYTENSADFTWSLLKRLDYKELSDDHEEDLELLWLLVMEEYPQAKQMRPGRK